MTSISVIVPVYRLPADYLQQCVSSILSQTMDDLEIILVDDGCPDGGGAQCAGFAEGDNRVSVIHQPNAGAAAARNAGMLAATGRYILFVDGDDWLDPQLCEALFRAAEETGFPVTFAGYRDEFQGHSSQLQPMERDWDFFRKDLEQLQLHILNPNPDWVAFACSPWAKLYRRSFLTQHSFLFPEGVPVSEDSVFNLRVYQFLDVARYVAGPCYHYRRRKTSATHSAPSTNGEFGLQFLDRFDDFVRQYRDGEPAFELGLAIARVAALSRYEKAFVLNEFPYKAKYALLDSLIREPALSTALEQLAREPNLERKYSLRVFLLRRGWLGLYLSLTRLFWQRRFRRLDYREGFYP